MLNRAKFLQNGNCGYVLKPSVLSNPEIYSLQNTDKLGKMQGRKVSFMQLDNCSAWSKAKAQRLTQRFGSKCNTKLGEFTMVSQPIRLILVDWFKFN
jgi:hypothetical protein